MRWTALIGLVFLVACGGKDAEQPNTLPAAKTTNQADEKRPGESPEKTAPEPEEQAPPVSQIEAEFVAFEGGLRAYPARRRVELTVYFLSDQTRPLEFLLVDPGGAIHESLFTTTAKAEHLKRALEIIDLQEAKTKRIGRGHIEKPLGDRIQIDVRFRHQETGKETVVSVEEWLWDARLDSTPEKVGWVFTGSHERYQPEINRSFIEADMRGNHIALWRDASCVIDNDRTSGGIPDVYSPNFRADGIPRPQARGQYPEVTLIFRPFEE